MKTRPNPRGDPHSERLEYIADCERYILKLKLARKAFDDLSHRIDLALKRANAEWERLERYTERKRKP